MAGPAPQPQLPSPGGLIRGSGRAGALCCTWCRQPREGSLALGITTRTASTSPATPGRALRRSPPYRGLQLPAGSAPHSPLKTTSPGVPCAGQTTTPGMHRAAPLPPVLHLPSCLGARRACRGGGAGRGSGGGRSPPPSTWCAARRARGRGGARGLRRFFAAVRPGAAAVFRPGDRLLCR